MGASMHQEDSQLCPAFIWRLSGISLCSGGEDRASGEGEQAAGLRRDEGFPWQPLLAHSEDSSAVPQASFLWTLKPALLAAELDFRKTGMW